MSIARIFVLAVALMACAVAAAAEPPAAADLAGLYVLSATPGSAHCLLLDADGTFGATLTTSGNALPTVRGHWTVDAAGLLRLRYFNGEKPVAVVTTCAVVDGHLWLGVFRKSAHPKRDLWVMETRNMGVFGTLTGRAPNCRIVWLMDAGTWSCIYRPLRGGENVARFAGISILRVSANQPPDRRFLPIFPKDITFPTPNSFPKLSMYFRHGTHLGTYSVVSVGLLATKEWTLARAAGAFRPPLTQLDTFRKLVSIQSRAAAGDTVIHRTWEQRDNVILTPWSLDLGPAAVVPLKKDFPKLPSQWKSADIADKRVKVIVDLTPAADRIPTPPGWRPTPEQMKTLFDTATFRPNVDGVSVVRWSWDCGAGHMDVAGHLVSCITKDGRFVRWIYPGGCGGQFPRRSPARAQVFLRTRSEQK